MGTRRLDDSAEGGSPHDKTHAAAILSARPVPRTITSYLSESSMGVVRIRLRVSRRENLGCAAGLQLSAGRRATRVEGGGDRGGVRGVSGPLFERPP